MTIKDLNLDKILVKIGKEMQVVKNVSHGHCPTCSSLSDFLNFSQPCSVTQLGMRFQFLFLALITEKSDSI